MGSGTSRAMRSRRVAASTRSLTLTLTIGLAACLAPAVAGARQVGASRPAPPVDGPGTAPGLDSGRSGEAPGLGQRPAPEVSDPSVDRMRRYRLIESYGPPEAPGDGIGPFRVAYVETLDQAIESAGAAPRRTQLSSRVVLVSRPAIVGGLDRQNVSALVRRYESVQVSRDGQPDARADGPAGLDGQVFWVQDEGGPAPTILTLPGSQPMTQEQYGFMAYQQIYVPDLAGLLSPLHVGVGASWPVPEDAAEALVGNRIRSGALEAQFEDVVPPADGETASRAVIRVSGRLELVNSTTAINARIEFAFEEPAADRPGAEAEPGRGLRTLEPTMIDAKGAVVRLLMSQRDVIEMPDATGRVAGRATQLRQLNLERRLGPGADPVPALPSPFPTPSPENSWVTFRDPANRFLFRHPQDYRPSPIAPSDGETINLQRLQIAGVPDYLTFVFFPRGDVPPEIRPEPFVSRIVELWRSVPSPGVTVSRGSEGYLPEREWPGMRIYRLELPLTYRPEAFAIADAGRAYFAAYLIQLANGAVLEVEGLTEGRPDTFRDEVEAILKTFAADPPAPRGLSPSPSQAPPASRPGAAPAPPASGPQTPPGTPEPEPDLDVPPVEPGTDVPPVEPGTDVPPDSPPPDDAPPRRPPPPL